MNKNERTTATTTVAISSMFAAAFVFVWSINLSQIAVGQAEEVFGGNATFIEEMEGTSFTTPAPAIASGNVTTNVTSEDIEPIRESLNAAREGLQSNEAQVVLDSLNDADGALFVIITEEPEGPIANQLSTLQGSIDMSRESLHGNNNEKALKDLNEADSQLLVITQMLPAEESEEESEE